MTYLFDSPLTLDFESFQEHSTKKWLHLPPSTFPTYLMVNLMASRHLYVTVVTVSFVRVYDTLL